MSQKNLQNMFKERLNSAFRDMKITRAEFCRKSHIDPAAFTHFLNGTDGRLPRFDTLASLARNLNVSADWLLGLSTDRNSTGEIIKKSFHISESTSSDASSYVSWVENEDRDLRLRISSHNIADFFKIPDVFEHEFRNSRTPLKEIMSYKTRLQSILFEYSCEFFVAKQEIDYFVQGIGEWEGLSSKTLKKQIDHMVEKIESTYPRHQIYLYDKKDIRSVPVIVMGSKKTLMWLSTHYFLFNTKTHVDAFNEHLDFLIKKASIFPKDASDYFKDLRKKLP